jgi:hypothetical protein
VQSEVSVWAAGLRRTGTRPLSDAERAELDARERVFRVRGLWALGFIPVLGGALAAILLLWGREPAHALTAVPVILLTILTPVLVLIARDCLTLARDLARDRTSGQAERFEGVVGPLGTVDPALRRLLQTGLLHPGGSQPQWFEVLPASGLVWQANGARPAHWIRASLAQTANLPTYASIAAEWVESVDRSRDDAFHVGKRELSEGESEELRRHRRRLLVRPVVTAGLLNLWLSLAVWAHLTAAYDLAEVHRTFLFAVLVALTVQATWTLARALWLAARFARDLRLRLAIIVRTPSLIHRDENGPPPLMPPDEFLAVSGVLWTRGGVPAHWRMAPTR